VHGMEYTCTCIHLSTSTSTCIQTTSDGNEPQPNESNHGKTPAGFNITILWSRTRACRRACVRGATRMSPLPPGNLAVPESKATLACAWLGSSPRQHKRKSGHAAELNQPDDREQPWRKRLIFFSLSASSAPPPLTCCCLLPTQEGRDSPG
jgi:hypothetical protein